jgi:hypothetical protein
MKRMTGWWLGVFLSAVLVFLLLVWWKRYRSARLFARYFVRVRSAFDGIHSIVTQRQPGPWIKLGPASLATQFRELDLLFGEYHKIRPQAGYLSAPLTQRIELTQQFARFMGGEMQRLALPYIEHVVAWEGNSDPTTEAMWSTWMEFVSIALHEYDRVIKHLLAVDPRDLLLPFRPSSWASLRMWPR